MHSWHTCLYSTASSVAQCSQLLNPPCRGGTAFFLQVQFGKHPSRQQPLVGPPGICVCCDLHHPGGKQPRQAAGPHTQLFCGQQFLGNTGCVALQPDGHTGCHSCAQRSQYPVGIAQLVPTSPRLYLKPCLKLSTVTVMKLVAQAVVCAVYALRLQLLWHTTSSALRLYLAHLASPGASTAGATHTALLRDIPGVSRGTFQVGLEKETCRHCRGWSK
jgi:hypothetical protein